MDGVGVLVGSGQHHRTPLQPDTVHIALVSDAGQFQCETCAEKGSEQWDQVTSSQSTNLDPPSTCHLEPCENVATMSGLRAWERRRRMIMNGVMRMHAVDQIVFMPIILLIIIIATSSMALLDLSKFNKQTPIQLYGTAKGCLPILSNTACQSNRLQCNIGHSTYWLVNDNHSPLHVWPLHRMVKVYNWEETSSTWTSSACWHSSIQFKLIIHFRHAYSTDLVPKWLDRPASRLLLSSSSSPLEGHN